jgi:hypothetical protein
MYKDNIQNKQKNKDVQGHYSKQVEKKDVQGQYPKPVEK